MRSGPSSGGGPSCDRASLAVLASRTPHQGDVATGRVNEHPGKSRTRCAAGRRPLRRGACVTSATPSRTFCMEHRFCMELRDATIRVRRLVSHAPCFETTSWSSTDEPGRSAGWRFRSVAAATQAAGRGLLSRRVTPQSGQPVQTRCHRCPVVHAVVGGSRRPYPCDTASTEDC